MPLFADMAKPACIEHQYKSFGEFLDSFERRNNSYGWVSKDHKVSFYKQGKTWSWGATNEASSESLFVDQSDFQTSDFKTRKDAVDYVKVCLPSVDVSSVVSGSGQIYMNAEGILLQQTSKGSKSWIATKGANFFYEESKHLKDVSHPISDVSRPKTLKKIWDNYKPVGV